MAVLGDIVFYKAKVPITRDDPRGAGNENSVANITNVPAVIARVINAGAGKMALMVCSDPPFGVIAFPFNSLDPTWGTWESKP